MCQLHFDLNSMVNARFSVWSYSSQALVGQFSYMIVTGLSNFLLVISPVARSRFSLSRVSAQMRRSTLLQFTKLVCRICFALIVVLVLSIFSSFMGIAQSLFPKSSVVVPWLLSFNKICDLLGYCLHLEGSDQDEGATNTSY
jgi:hypothetical protein